MVFFAAAACHAMYGSFFFPYHTRSSLSLRRRHGRAADRAPARASRHPECRGGKIKTGRVSARLQRRRELLLKTFHASILNNITEYYFVVIVSLSAEVFSQQ